MTIYDTIKAQEANFPIPKPSGTITVGTFNAATGDFSYTVPKYSRMIAEPADPTHGGPRKPVKVKVYGGSVTAINIYHLQLRFKVINRSGDFSVTIPGGTTQHAQPGQDYVDIDVGTATSASFSLKCGNSFFEPDIPLLIDRHIVGAGAMTLPVLPITILYSPPVDQQKKNIASWSATDLSGSTTTMSFSAQNSTTVPTAAPVMIEPWLELATEMNYAGQILSKIPNAYAQGAGAALGVISGLLGSSTNTSTVGKTVTTQNSLTVTLAQTDTVTTNPNGGGPGHADVLYFLKNAHVCWYTNGGPMKLALVGWEAVDTITAALLEDPSNPTRLDQKTRAALLKLDPFVPGGSGVTLPSPRFVLTETFDVNANHTYNLSYTITNTDMQQKVTSQTDVEDDSASFLAFANIGVPQTVKLQTTLTQTSAAQISTTKTITREVQFFANPSEYYSVEVYTDVVFGTFAFRSIGKTDSSKKLHGKLRDSSGKLLANREVILVSQGRKYRTISDKNGDFAFHASTISKAHAKLLTHGAVLVETPVIRPIPSPV